MPPPGVDVERVIARGRRRERLRRWATGGGAVAAVGLVGATLLVTAGGTGPQEQYAAPPVPSPSPSASANPTPSPLGKAYRTPPAEAQATEARLSEATKAALTRVVPGATTGRSHEGKDPFRFAYLYHEADRSGGDFDHYNAAADVTGNGRSGEVSLSVGRRSTVWSVPTDCTSFPAHLCTVSTGPRGETVLANRIEEGVVRDNYVAVTRPDGTAILIVAANQGGQGDTGGPRQTEPVLTMEQLIAIATDPALHI
ncbi:hypothetical protein Val02_07160 [Virgisporangium aliadipatigenens]|uniref:Uncharacterized protein n=2 Tax=Virgisporangium aliadipatigenens TaxID=741659 RepID=A0A8J3YGZ6_9ACTN|nr:hypothetical protein Val02_07160 [Virgisporangium aliadipatigenens]